MESVNTGRWTDESETAYMEERKYKCEYCHPEHESTIAWLDSKCNQEMVIAVYEKYGISPGAIYREYEMELQLLQDEELSESGIEEFEAELQER